jgi:hypothetical protein
MAGCVHKAVDCGFAASDHGDLKVMTVSDILAAQRSSRWRVRHLLPIGYEDIEWNGIPQMAHTERCYR